MQRLIIFQWGIWIQVITLTEKPVHTWLSSNEEFEFFSSFSNFSLSSNLIIFQWGIWIRKIGEEYKQKIALDYLPMRNLNEHADKHADDWNTLDYLPMRNLNIRKVLRLFTELKTWLSSNEEFEFFEVDLLLQNYPCLIIFQWGIWMKKYKLIKPWRKHFLIIFQWGIWIFPALETICTSTFLIIFQWGIWIHSQLPY